MIYVTGGRGWHLGRAVVQQLTQSGQRVRVLAGSAEEGQALAGSNIEVVVGDCEQPETFAHTLDGVAAAMMITRNSLKFVEMEANFIAAAKAARVGRLVKLSALGADVNDETQVKRSHGRTEEMLKQSGLTWTILRPHFFMQNVLWFIDEVRTRGAISLPMKSARQSWCSGNIGTAGISYHATTQWRVAGLQPPALKAMIPWEGWGDCYRDASFHGGIFQLYYLATWYATQMAHHLLGDPQEYNPDAFRNERLYQYMRHSLDTGWWDNRSAQWDKIKVPFLSAGNWSGHNLHLRGNTEGYVRAASKHKKLRVHTGTHYHAFYTEEGRRDQLRWFDYWLKGIDTGIMDEPPVKLLIRTGGGGMNDYKFRFENEWPLKRTQWTRFYLRADRKEPAPEPMGCEGSLLKQAPGKRAALTYSATGVSHAGVASASSTMLAAGATHRIGVSFETAPMKADTEVTGPIKLVLWVSSTRKDMDIFATIRNIGPDGKDVWEVGQQGQQVPVAKGWLRASHRKLDSRMSLPYRPYHAHNERWWLKSGEPVECEIEIWPACMVFKQGHRIRLDIQPRDGVGSAPYLHYPAAYNTGGENTVHTGGSMASYLLLPVIPRKP